MNEENLNPGVREIIEYHKRYLPDVPFDLALAQTQTPAQSDKLPMNLWYHNINTNVHISGLKRETWANDDYDVFIKIEIRHNGRLIYKANHD